MPSKLPLEQLCTHLWLPFEELLLLNAQQAFHLQPGLDKFFNQTMDLGRLLDQPKVGHNLHQILDRSLVLFSTFGIILEQLNQVFLLEGGSLLHYSLLAHLLLGVLDSARFL